MRFLPRAVRVALAHIAVKMLCVVRPGTAEFWAVEEQRMSWVVRADGEHEP